jgi:hypothetical protein
MRTRLHLHVVFWCVPFAIFITLSFPNVGPAVLENKIGPVSPNHSTDSYGSVLTLMPWIKSEGVVLWSILAVLGSVVGLVRHRIRLFIIGILPGLILILSSPIYLRAIDVVMPADFARPTLQLPSRNHLSRLPPISRMALVELTDSGLWSIFCLLTAMTVVYLVPTLRFSRLLVVTGLLSPVILYLITYVFSAWLSYMAHITSSLPRLLLQVVPVGWLAIGLAWASPKVEPGKRAFD